MATNRLVCVAGKVKTFQGRTTDVLNTICTEKPLKIETSTKLEGELKAILEETGELIEELASLKQQICELEATSKGKLKEQVKALEAEVKTLKTLKTQVTEMLGEIGKLDGEKMALEEKVVNLEHTVESLKKKNVDLCDAVKSLQGQVTSLTNKVVQLQDSDDELLLGQLCWRIQSMIFKKVLPPSEYNKNVSYKLYHIEDHIDALGNDEDIRESERAWAKLQHELSLNERDIKRLAIAMKDTQSQRNVIAHPELTEQELLESAKRMKGKGELKTSYENITKLINLWKELEKLQ